MKLSKLSVALLLLLTACETKGRVIEGTKCFGFSKREFGGHTYVMYLYSGGGMHFVHDVDCPCDKHPKEGE